MHLQDIGGAASPAAVAPIVPVILCGGSGTRLWPLSRPLHPKQLLALTRSETMLQATVARVDAPPFAQPLIVTGEDHGLLVREQLGATHAAGAPIILEPQARNTAPAIALAAHRVRQSAPDALMLVMPSDHEIADERQFRAAVAAAVPAALAGRLVTFGIAPGAPETGYGYIEAGAELAATPGVREVARFVEKPDLATARAWCESGSHFWNGGIFLFRATAFLGELEALAPDVAACCAAAIADAVGDGDFVRPAPAPFAACPGISVDYAVMERTQKACVVPVAMGWSDVGSWHALWDISDKDSQRNVLRGDVIAIDSRGSLLRSDGSLTVAAVGVDNLVVIVTGDAVLVIPRDRAQDARLVVDALKAAGRGREEVQRGTCPVALDGVPEPLSRVA